jgi:hypothetical protein
MIVGGAAIAGVGMQGYGAMKGSKAAKQQAAAAQAQAAEEMRLNALRRQQMELENQRKQREQIRSGQRARALALTTSTAQGASGAGSSALGGAYGQISGGLQNNLLGLNQAHQMGILSFGINDNISGIRQQMAGYQSDMATAQGWSSFGGSLMGAASTMGRIGGNLGGGTQSLGMNYSQPTFGVTPNYGGMY